MGTDAGRRAGLGHSEGGEGRVGRRGRRVRQRSADDTKADGMLALVVGSGADKVLVEHFALEILGLGLGGAGGRAGRVLDHRGHVFNGARGKVGRRAGAVGGAGVIRRTLVEAAAAHNARHATRRANGIDCARGRILAVPIETPFRDAGVEILHAPRVGLAGGGRFFAGKEQGIGAGATRELPFCFGRKAVRPSVLPAQPNTKCIRLIPADAGGVRGKLGGAQKADPKFLKLRDGGLFFGDEEPLRDRDLVGRMFVPIATGQIVRLAE